MAGASTCSDHLSLVMSRFEARLVTLEPSRPGAGPAGRALAVVAGAGRTNVKTRDWSRRKLVQESAGGQIWLLQAILDTLVESLARIAKQRHLVETRFEVLRRCFEKPNLMRAGRYDHVHVRCRLVVACWLSVWSRFGVVLRPELVSAVSPVFSVTTFL
ncbi:hypothetical protein F511_38461 [Dorcoceras hygrometricum]|uniref:Uncharacterized protein n=1 Tax=Dorcoceras hygrometricum TaxID=472368 RepID=A0A2Z7D4U3_9LAMI|nr:hypothetical protein F511_38461 [Dorcoceras hygrometricum]